jgi:DNA-binding Xre family transcriptional regulator
VQGGYDWATGNDRFLFENNSIEFGSYDVLPRLCVRLECTEKEILNFIKKSI